MKLIPYSKTLWQWKNLADKDCKKFGGRTVWRIEVHLHMECYRNCENWQKSLWIAVANLPKYFYNQCFLLYGTILLGSYAWTIATWYCQILQHVSLYNLLLHLYIRLLNFAEIYNASSFVNQPASYHMYVHALHN